MDLSKTHTRQEIPDNHLYVQCFQRCLCSNEGDIVQCANKRMRYSGHHVLNYLQTSYMVYIKRLTRYACTTTSKTRLILDIQLRKSITMKMLNSLMSTYDLPKQKKPHCCLVTPYGFVPQAQHWSSKDTLIARFMGPTWDPSGADMTQVGPMLALWTLLSGNLCCS